MPMTDPWDERYIDLYENHKNQSNVGKYTIHGSYGMWYNASKPYLTLAVSGCKDLHPFGPPVRGTILNDILDEPTIS